MFSLKVLPDNVGLPLVAPTQDHTLVQLPPGAGTRGFTALSGNLIDVAFDERGAPEDDLHRTLHLSQEMPQLLTEAAAMVKILSG